MAEMSKICSSYQSKKYDAIKLQNGYSNNRVETKRVIPKLVNKLSVQITAGEMGSYKELTFEADDLKQFTLH